MAISIDNKRKGICTLASMFEDDIGEDEYREAIEEDIYSD